MDEKQFQMQINDDNTEKILQLIHDSRFVEFEIERESPTIFNAVGRTHTETWHSAFLAWLLDPKGSHDLNEFPIKRLLLLAHQVENLTIEQRGIDLAHFLLTANFSDAEVWPNERVPLEKTFGDGRFDVFVEKIGYENWKDVKIIIEIKVKAAISQNQCNKYIAHAQEKIKEKEFVLPFFLAPSEKLTGSTKNIFGDEMWLAVDYQQVYDDIIEPCLSHPHISSFGKMALNEYVKTLKHRTGKEKPLIMTQREQELVECLLVDHGAAIQSLYDILKQRGKHFEPDGLTSKEPPAAAIEVNINGKSFHAHSISELYEQALKYLVDGNYLKSLELPVRSGPKRFLLSNTPYHAHGNEFVAPISYNGLHMETNKSRDQAVRDLAMLVGKCGLEMT